MLLSPLLAAVVISQAEPTYVREVKFCCIDFFFEWLYRAREEFLDSVEVNGRNFGFDEHFFLYLVSLFFFAFVLFSVFGREASFLVGIPDVALH